jgi:hypothetical protein
VITCSLRTFIKSLIPPVFLTIMKSLLRKRGVGFLSIHSALQDIPDEKVWSSSAWYALSSEKLESLSNFTSDCSSYSYDDLLVFLINMVSTREGVRGSCSVLDWGGVQA